MIWFDPFGSDCDLSNDPRSEGNSMKILENIKIIREKLKDIGTLANELKNTYEYSHDIPIYNTISKKCTEIQKHIRDIKMIAINKKEMAKNHKDEIKLKRKIPIRKSVEELNLSNPDDLKKIEDKLYRIKYN